MTKSKFVICLFVLLLSLSSTICYATSDIDMNLLSNSVNNTTRNSNTNSSTNTSNTLTEDEDIYEDEENETYTPSASVSSTTYADSDELKIGDIINICLIVVGVLLILLSIAILIRLKS